MALGITNDGTKVIYEVPLRGLNDHKWEDRSWICEHLHQLADKIKETKFEIYSIGLEMNHQYNAPTLIIKGWEKNKEILADMVDSLGQPTELTISLSIFQGFSDREKWGIYKNMTNIDWRCPDCGNIMEKPHSPGMDTIQCKHCWYVLSHRTNGGQNNPFNWVFTRKEK